MEKFKAFIDLLDTDTGAAYFIAAMIVVAVAFNPMTIAYLIVGSMAAAAIVFVGTPVKRWLDLRALEKSFVNE